MIKGNKLVFRQVGDFTLVSQDDLENINYLRKISFNSETKQQVKLQRKGQILMQNDYLNLNRCIFLRDLLSLWKMFHKIYQYKKTPKFKKGQM